MKRLWIFDEGTDIMRGPASQEQIAVWEICKKQGRPYIINYHGCPTKVEMRWREPWEHKVKLVAPVYPPSAPPIVS
jgi:hypothetical protein